MLSVTLYHYSNLCSYHVNAVILRFDSERIFIYGYDIFVPNDTWKIGGIQNVNSEEEEGIWYAACIMYLSKDHG